VQFCGHGKEILIFGFLGMLNQGTQGTVSED